MRSEETERELSSPGNWFVPPGSNQSSGFGRDDEKSLFSG
jgi:hypothetical protein